MSHFKRLTETLVTALFLSLLLTTITSAVDVPLPEGGGIEATGPCPRI